MKIPSFQVYRRPIDALLKQVIQVNPDGTFFISSSRMQRTQYAITSHNRLHVADLMGHLRHQILQVDASGERSAIRRAAKTIASSCAHTHMSAGTDRSDRWHNKGTFVTTLDTDQHSQSVLADHGSMTPYVDRNQRFSIMQLSPLNTFPPDKL